MIINPQPFTWNILITTEIIFTFLQIKDERSENTDPGFTLKGPYRKWCSWCSCCPCVTTRDTATQTSVRTLLALSSSQMKDAWQSDIITTLTWTSGRRSRKYQLMTTCFCLHDQHKHVNTKSIKPSQQRRKLIICVHLSRLLIGGRPDWRPAARSGCCCSVDWWPSKQTNKQTKCHCSERSHVYKHSHTCVYINVL